MVIFMKKCEMAKRVFGVLLVIFMLAYTLPIAASAKQFSDVSSTHSSLDAINYVSDNGIMNGTSSTEFDLYSTVSRAMVITTLYRKAGSPAVSGTNKFNDVSPSDYFYNAVRWGTTTGIVNGTSDTTFTPYAAISRQDVAVMLYRLGGHMGYDMSKTANITGYADYNDVASYARTAMAWGVGTRVIPPSGGLYPRRTVNRVQLAEFITTFGTSVERIRSKKDHLGITNCSADFSGKQKYITNAHLNKLKAAIRNNLTTSNANSTIEQIDDYLTKEWNGSCYGMSLVTILDKMGKIAFNENYGSGTGSNIAKAMHNVCKISKTKAESAINYYHLTQFIPGAKNPFNSNFETEIPRFAETVMRSNTPFLFSFIFQKSDGSTAGHAIVINSCKKSGSSYIVNVYNPNEDGCSNLTLTTDGQLGPWKFIQFSPIGIYSFFDTYDIDSYVNSDTTSTSATYLGSATPTVPYTSECSSIEVELNGNFIIRNEKGTYLQWDGSDLTGDMEIYDTRMIVDGPEGNCSLIIDVPVSENFYFESLTENADIWFGVADPYRYSRVSGKALLSVSVGKSGKMELDGVYDDFETAYSVPGENTPLLKLAGTGKGHITAECQGDSLKASGDIREYTISSIDSTGNLMYNQVVTPRPVDESMDSSQAGILDKEDLDPTVSESGESVMPDETNTDSSAAEIEDGDGSSSMLSEPGGFSSTP